MKVVAITLGESEAEVIQLAEAGVAGYLLPDGSLDDLVIAIESAVRGELYCPPRVSFTLLRRLGALAASLRDDEEKATHSPLRALTGREREILHLVDDGMTNKGDRRPSRHRAGNGEEPCPQHSQEAARAQAHRRVGVVPARRLPPQAGAPEVLPRAGRSKSPTARVAVRL